MLARAFAADGHEVVVLSRSPASVPWRVVEWDAKTPGNWTREIDGADVVVNLAGRSVNCRYTPANRRLIKDSRVDSTRAIGNAIANSPNPPRVWLQAGTATIYAHRFDAPNDDVTGIVGVGEQAIPDTWRFSTDVAESWERAVNEAEVPRTRRVILRSAMVMSPDRGGVFDVLLRLVRLGLGGRMGSGRQYVSWMHDRDFIRAVYWAIAHEELSGAINYASPDPVPNEEFMRTLRRAWGAPIGLPASSWMLKAGTFFMRSESELVLKSRRVIPRLLVDSGFEFEFPTWESAARDLCRRARGS